MIDCKAHRHNGSFKWIRLPDPKSRQKNFLVEIGRQLHLPGEGQLTALDTFYKTGYTHITSLNGTVLYGTKPPQAQLLPAAESLDNQERRFSWRAQKRRRRFFRPRLWEGFRPIAVALAFNEHAA